MDTREGPLPRQRRRSTPSRSSGDPSSTRPRVDEYHPGREYIIFAVLIDPDSAWLEWFYIIDDLELSFPTWYPSCAFEITGPSLPSIWVYGSEWLPNPARPGHPRQLLLANREWVEDPGFYERLTNEEDRELSIFSEVRRRIEEESLSESPLPRN